jgi:hypothetical protein
VFGLSLVISMTTMLASPSVALAKGYAPGFYSGRTSQGRSITFLVAAGQVTNLDTEIVDSCNPGTYDVSLYPNPSRIDAAGSWSRRSAEVPSQPTIYHGQLSGRTASGTITDTSDNSRRKACHGHTTFHATVSSPVSVNKATVGHLGTDVELNVTMPTASNGNMLVPYTPTALLVYGSNVGCPGAYAAADRLARNEVSDGFDGLISDAFVDADYETQPYEGAYYAYKQGVFTFHVATNTLLPTSGDQSPYSTVCVMLYSGEPASQTPSHNIVLETTRHALVFGPGIPNTQP